MNAVSGRVEPDQKELEDIVAMVLDYARQNDVDQAEVAATHDIGLTATVRLGEVESLEYTNDRGVGITVFKDHRKGGASTSDFNPSALRDAVNKACSIAELTAADKYAGLADPETMATDPPDLDLAYNWHLESKAAIRIAVECEDAARAYDKRITNSEGATIGTSGGVRAYANTHGFLAAYPKTSHSLSCIVIGEQNGSMERDYWYTSARDPASLDSATMVGEKAARRTVERLGARKLQTINAPIIYAPEMARGFIGHAIRAIAGGAQYRRSSFLLDAMGETIFPDFVCIEERPHIPGGIASAPYDAEGVRTVDRDLVVGGVLQGYLLSSYSARKLGLVTTGNAGGAHNLLVPGNGGDMQSMMKEMGSGLIVHELIGQGVNAVTGDYSRGAVGYWVEGGEIAYPVHEITIAGNLRDLYQRVERIGDDQDLRGGIRCGSVLVSEMKIAGS